MLSKVVTKHHTLLPVSSSNKTSNKSLHGHIAILVRRGTASWQYMMFIACPATAGHVCALFWAAQAVCEVVVAGTQMCTKLYDEQYTICAVQRVASHPSLGA